MLPSRERTEQQPKSAMSTGSMGADAGGSELVADAGAHGVDRGIDRGGEAHVLPLDAHEQVGEQHHVDTETAGIAVDEMRVGVVGRIVSYNTSHGNIRKPRNLRADIGVFQVVPCVTVDVGLPERDAAEQIWKETTPGITAANAQRSVIPDIHRRAREDICSSLIVAREEEGSALRALGTVGEFAVDVVELDAGNDVGPLRVVT